LTFLRCFQCASGVLESGKGEGKKDLGLSYSEDKTKAIIEMPPPQREKEGRGFDGRIEYYSRFIARLTPICKPIQI